NLCLRRGQEAQCTQIEPLNANVDFEFTLPLSPGDNDFCLSSFDAAGNQSPENCQTVRLIAESAVTWLNPLNGSIITQNSFTARVRATDEEGIRAVEICFNNDDCGAGTLTNPNAGIYERTINPGELVNGSVHELRATATNLADRTGEATISVVYVVGGLLLSESIAAESERPRVAVDGNGDIHVVWSDECSQFAECQVPTNNNFPYDIFHRVFNGETWSSINNLSLNVGDGDSRNPSIASDEQGRIHVIWQDNGTIDNSGTDFDIFHTIYDPEAGAWSNSSTITLGSETDDTNPKIATGPGASVVAVWQSRDGAESDIFISRFVNNTWTPAQIVTDHPQDGDSRSPSLAVSSLGSAMVVWQERGDIDGSGPDWDIWFRQIEADGTAGEYILVTDNNLDGVSLQPDIAAGVDEFAHIVWRDNSTFESSGDDVDIFYRRYSVVNGLEPYRLVTRDPADGQSEEVSITINPETNELYIAWLDTGDIFSSGEDADVYFMRYAGAPGPTTLISAGASFNNTSEWPATAFDPQTKNLHIVWEDDSVIGDNGEDRDVFYLGVNLE
ncbi:MAG: hypothetical protein AAFX99_29135, partial [Myxococcota bacterium]